MLTLQSFPELKDSLRIDGSEDDDVLILLLDAAKASLKVAGVPEDKMTTDYLPLYKQAIILYLEMDYEYDEKKIPRLERAFNRILLQLKAGVSYE